jgi:C4-type Zn-finger protein
MPAESNTRNMLCPGCDQDMTLVQTIPQSGVLSEIVVFYCERCKQAETIAQKRAA